MSPESKTPARDLPWATFRKRWCENQQQCVLCGGLVTYGEAYRDGGNKKRAHERCVYNLAKERTS